MRDGRDVALSIKKRTGNFEQGIERWVNDNNAITQSLSSKHVHIINYENFVSSPVNTINNLSDFLGETLNKRILNNIEFGRKNFYNEKSDNSSHGHRRNEQINQNLIDYSGLWKRGLSNNEKFIFK